MQVSDASGSAWYAFTNTDAKGRPFDILIVKESYSILDDFSLALRPEPELICFADTCYADPTFSSVFMPSDVVPYKPRADVVVSANTYAPNSVAATDWPFGISIGERAIRLHAFGPSVWKRMLGVWRQSQTEPVLSVPVRYEHAYGGQMVLPQQDAPDIVEVSHTNPVGTGWVDASLGKRPSRVAAPQILWGDEPQRDPEQVKTPAGLGAIPPAWLPRRPLGGTYDENWQKHHAPHWAPDYDFAYHNCAPAALQMAGFLHGSESLNFSNLRPDVADLTLQLPGTGLLAEVTDQDGMTQPYQMAADTLFVDLLPDWLGACLVAVTWRLVLPHQTVSHVGLSRVPGTDPKWTRAHKAPHPHDITQNAKAA